MDKNKQLTDVSNKLKELLQKKVDALPKSFNETRFLQNALTVLSDTEDIEKYNTQSIARTMLQGAFLGLDFFMKECYAIPYGLNLQFQTDYKGEIKLAKKYSINPVKDIYAKVVREGDLFEASIEDGRQVVNFKPINFNDGVILGAFAVCLFEDGSMIYDEMSLKEIEKTRSNFSKAPDSKAWRMTPEEMYKKTVIRRLCKLIHLEFESAEQRRAFEEGSDVDHKKFKWETIEVETQDPFSKKPEEVADEAKLK